MAVIHNILGFGLIILGFGLICGLVCMAYSMGVSVGKEATRPQEPDIACDHTHGGDDDV